MTSEPQIWAARRIATMADGEPGYGLISNGRIISQNGKILWVGTAADMPLDYAPCQITDFGERLITPALIDCHTHIVHGGNRAAEFEMRLNGASYAEIARAGGGILSTVRDTRAADLHHLVMEALPRVDALIAEGVSVIEVKSGYGLEADTELRMLRAARQIGAQRPVAIKTSFLAAHAVPPEYKGRSDDYIDHVCIPTLRAAAEQGLVDYVDGFCENIAFDTDQIARVFDAARSLGLPVRLHAEQLSNLGGAIVAARYGALSADHLEYLDDAGIAAMAAAGTVAVLLPGAFYALRETKLPPVAGLREKAVPIAVATDMNPGTSPMTSLLLAMNMACTLFRLTPIEALAGTTRHAARALGLADHGQIAVGATANLAVWNCAHPAELSYRIGFNPLHRRIYGDAP